jgi:hypothetical protein
VTESHSAFLVGEIRTTLPNDIEETRCFGSVVEEAIEENVGKYGKR